MNITVTEFQVVERYDSTKQKVWRVELQYRQVIETDSGSTIYSSNWVTVPRTRVFEPELL